LKEILGLVPKKHRSGTIGWPAPPDGFVPQLVVAGKFDRVKTVAIINFGRIRIFRKGCDEAQVLGC
jgi:hypothetical protein